MKYGLIAAGFFLVLITIGAIVIYARTGSRASIVMISGAAIFWIGAGLTLFGPQNRKVSRSSPPDAASDVWIESMTVIATPALPVGYIMGAGLLLLAVGFLFHAVSD